MSSSNNAQPAASSEHFCPTCVKHYGTASQLARHLNTASAHTAERPFVCTVEGCSKSFTRKDELARHKRKVHPALPVANNQSASNAASASAASNIPTATAPVATGSSAQSSGAGASMPAQGTIAVDVANDPAQEEASSSTAGEKRKRADEDVEGRDPGAEKRQAVFADDASRNLAELEAENAALRLQLAVKDEEIAEKDKEIAKLNEDYDKLVVQLYDPRL